MFTIIIIKFMIPITGPVPQLRRHRAAAPAPAPGAPHRGGRDGERPAVLLRVGGCPREGIQALDVRHDRAALGLAGATRQEGSGEGEGGDLRSTGLVS